MIFLASYAQDSTFRFEPTNMREQGLPADFAIDLENGIIKVDYDVFQEQDYSPQAAMVGIMHETEHLRELGQLLGERDGYKVWQSELSKARRTPRLRILDNCVDDVRVYRNIFDRAPAQKQEVETLFYQKSGWENTDFTQSPLHLQFAQALLRTGFNPEEPVQVDEKVQKYLDQLNDIKTPQGENLLSFITKPDLSPSLRIKLQEKFLEPIYEVLFQEDLEKRKQEEENAKNQNQEGQGQSQEGGSGSEPDEQTEGEEPGSEEEGKSKDKSEKNKPSRKRPEDYFEEEYEEFDKKNPEIIPQKDLNKAIREYIRNKQKSSDQLRDEAYAREQGVSVQDLKNYRAFWQKLQDLKNPETDESVIEELRTIFRQIISEREKPRITSKIPREEGEILIDPVRAYIDVESGKQETRSWLKLEKTEKIAELYGNFDITWVVDRSSSMNFGNGEKIIQQKISTILGLEAIKEFCNELEEASADIKQELNVRSEVWSFGANDEENGEPVQILKPLSGELSERQRVAVYKNLDDCPGGTPDFLALEKIRENLSDEDTRKIKEGKLRKVVIVQTDGGSDDQERLKQAINNLRQVGIAVVAVGNGIQENSEDANTIRDAYKNPDGSQGAQICPRAEQTPQVLTDLLKTFLSELM